MLSLPQVPHRLDLPAVSHYLTSVRTSLGRRSLIRDVSALQPGETLSLAPGREAVLRTYWRIPVVAAGDKPDPGLGAAAEQACSLLREAVTAQMVSDVPLGGFLSGGLDSCAITHFAHARTAEAYRTYNVGYEGEGYNEWPFARESAAFYGVPCDIECLSADGYPGVWQRLIREKGLPLSTPNEVPIVHLAEALRQTCTVALSGEGSDEIFGGYPIPHFSARDFELSRRSPPGPDSVLSPFERNLEQVYGRCFFHCLADHYFAGNSWIPMARKRLLLTDSAWETLEEDDALFCWYEDLFDELAPCTAFDAYMHVHARVNLEGLLSRVDSSTMSASVEARVPFTDHRLVEFLFSLPDSHKIDWLDAGAREQGLSLPAVELDRRGLLETKRLLRRGLQGAVPDSILRRPKMSFPVPFPAWFADSWRPLATAAVEASSLPGSLFDAGAVQALLSGSDLPLNALALWPVVNLCLWQTEWNLSL
jgi:asparagine synthase (glutamine-hydrolysing)